VRVDASVTSIVTAKITDERTFAYKLPRFVAGASFTQGSSSSASQIGGTVTTWTATETLGGAWTASTSGWAIPRAGLYVVSFQTQGTAALAGHQNVVTKGGSPIAGMVAGGGTLVSVVNTQWLECATGDVIGIELGQNAGSSQTMVANTRIACVAFA
jgi:hypothetical protein